jgi:hypothetical protein
LIEGDQDPDADLHKADPHEIPVAKRPSQEFRKSQQTLTHQENTGQTGHCQAKNRLSCQESKEYGK